jgi:S1-C subfamily serine protease
MKRWLTAVLLPLIFLTGCMPDGSGARKYVHRLTDGNGVGSMVLLAPGLALTAEHVTKIPNLTAADGKSTGVIIGKGGSDELDIGLLRYPRAEAECPCVILATSDAEPDEPVYVIGNPMGIAEVVTLGRSQGVHPVSAPGFMGMPGQYLSKRLVLTALVAPGNSGGGVFVFRRGEYQLVGILTEQYNHLSLAVPISLIRPFLQINLPFLDL